MTPKKPLRFILLLLLPFLPPIHAIPQCENPPHPLPALSSCLYLVHQIHHDAKTQPYLYHWSRHPSKFDERRLPATWIESASPYTYVCSVSVDLVRGHEAEEESFTYKDVADAVDRVVRDCLTPVERGMRPMVGWEMIGFFKRPEVVRVQVGSTRRSSGGLVLGTLGRGNRTVSAVRAGEGNRTASLRAGNGTDRVTTS